MQLWSFFRTVRKVGFSVISVLSILWAILLSVYLAHEWEHAVKSQRIIALLMIGVYIYSSVLLYLMIVVIFRLWADFWRTVSLTAIHLGVAVPLTIFRPNFNCAVFDSEGTCTSTYIFALFITWSILVFFVFHAVFLCVLSRFPQPPQDIHTTSAEELNPPIEEEKGDLEKNVEPNSPSMVSQAERIQAFPARLVVMNGTARPAYTSRAQRQVSRTATSFSSMSEITDDIPTLPYGASSMDGFLKPSSPAPSYTSQDPMQTPLRQPPTRRARPLLLNRYVLDPVARAGTPDSPFSVSTVGSRDSAYSHIADASHLARPPQAVIAGHIRSSSLSSDAVPPQLRPGTPISLHRTDSASSTSSTCSEGASLSMFTAHVASSTRVGTPSSIHSFTPSLLFMDGNSASSRTPSPAPAVSGSDMTKKLGASGLSRQPTVAMKLPNPYDSVDPEAITRDNPMPERSSSMDRRWGES